MDGFEYGQSFKWLLWFLLLEYGFMATLLEPGFLDFDNLPDTNFTCVGKVIGGYYADLETACQMFHVCTIGQLDEPMDIRFLCLNGTVFDQETRVCERIDEVDCAKSEQFYSLNLELYGNTQAPILSESEEADGPSKGHSTTAASHTSSTSSDPKVTRQSFIITTARPTKTTELYKPHTTPQKPSTTSRYQIPINRPPDIRFNPKEINLSLNIRGTAGEEPYHRHSSTQRLLEQYTTQRVPSKFVRNNQPLVKPTVRTTTTTTTEAYEDTEHYIDFQKNYQYRVNVPNFRPSSTGFVRHNHNKYNHYQTNRPSVFYSPRNHQQRISLLQPSQSYYRNHQTEASQIKIQLDIPTRQPLMFSSPSPFRLSPQNQKPQRSYVHHQSPPRIVISASASVSDASGRKFNYSLGTIGDSQLFGHAPQSYDDYREEDVGFDPFYHDVLKLNRGGRRKRDVEADTTDAIDTLRFLFDWYSRNKMGDDQQINAMWDKKSGDVIYKSVIDTINQEDFVEAVKKSPAGGASHYDEYQENAEQFDQFIASRISKDNEEVAKSYDEDPLRNGGQDQGVEDQELTEKPLANVDDYNHRNINVQNTLPEEVINTPVKYKSSENFDENSTVNVYYSHGPQDQQFNEDYLKPLKQQPIGYYDEGTLINVPSNQPNKSAQVEEYKDVTEPTTQNTSYNVDESPLKNIDYNQQNYSAQEQEDKDEIVLPENQKGSNTFEDMALIINVDHNQQNKSIQDQKYEEVEDFIDPLKQNPIDNFEEYQEELKERINPEYVPQNYGFRHQSQPFTKILFDDIVLNTTIFKEESTSLSPRNVTESPSTDQNDKILQITEKYLQVLNILGVTTWQNVSQEVENRTTTQLELSTEETTRTSEDVLDLPLNASLETVEPTEPYLGTTTSQSYTTTPERRSFRGRIRAEYSTTIDPPITIYNEETSLDDDSTTLDHKEIATIPTVSVRPTVNGLTSTTVTPKSIASIFRSPKHRFNRLRPNTHRSRPQQQHSGQTVQRETTTESLPHPELVSQTFSIPEEVSTKNQTDLTSAKKPLLKNYVFNCFGKDLNQFYSDPRDCRLFHYCTNGFTRTQLLDMKFVCDSGTFFDSEKLVCTKSMPSRCI